MKRLKVLGIVIYIFTLIVIILASMGIWKKEAPGYSIQDDSHGFNTTLFCKSPCNSVLYGGITDPVLTLRINDDGKLEVGGDLTEGAKFFFEYTIKPMVDEYIKAHINDEK